MVPNKIFLIGLMGSGKSSVGRLLAKKLNKTFIDSDDEIVKKTGVSIQTIFDIEGEENFRVREQDVISNLTLNDNTVLATGGGVILSEQNRETLKSNGYVIYLKASANQLYSRLRFDKTRPLLQTSNPKAKLQELFALRDPLYLSTADWVLNSGSMKSCKMATTKILKHLKSI